MEANSTERGSTSGTILGVANKRNFKTETKSKSFPASSEINSQTVCKMKIKNRMTNTVKKVDMNCLNKYLSRIFTLCAVNLFC